MSPDHPVGTRDCHTFTELGRSLRVGRSVRLGLVVQRADAILAGSVFADIQIGTKLPSFLSVEDLA
jgi:hypothetical protein